MNVARGKVVKERNDVKMLAETMLEESVN